MRNHLTHFMIAAAAAALAAACGQGNNPDHGRYATEGGRGSAPPTAQNVKVDGCLGQGMRPDGDFILHDVVLAPPATQPNGQAVIEHPPIANGTWVRLVGDAKDANLESYVGKRIEVIGTIRDSGVNTLGTSGHEGTDAEKFERSSRDSGSNPQRGINPTTAAPNGADANGTAPRLSVEHITKLADSCEGESK
jgi:hypothetical protein